MSFRDLRRFMEGFREIQRDSWRFERFTEVYGSLLLPAALAAAETKKFATKDTRFNYIRRVC